MSEDVTKEPTEGQQPAPDAAPAEPKPDAAPAADAPKPAEGKTEEPKADEPVKSLLAEGEDEAKNEDADKPKEAPEQYEEFTLPEGFQKDGPLLEAFTPLAKEANLPQEMAQKFVDLGAKLVADTQAAQMKAWEGVVSEWTASLKADKEVGGAALKENTGYAVKALKQYADPETRKYLDDSRLANHPGLFKLLVRVGKTVSEDKLFEGGSARSESNPAKTLYPEWK